MAGDVIGVGWMEVSLEVGWMEEYSHRIVKYLLGEGLKITRFPCHWY